MVFGAGGRLSCARTCLTGAMLCCRAVSHEHAQLQKQLLAANEEAALSASLVHQLTADAGSAPLRQQAPQPERAPELAPDDGMALAAQSRSWDQSRPAVKVRLAP